MKGLVRSHNGSVPARAPLKVQVTKVFDRLQSSLLRVIVLQGGARSGKTMNTTIWLIFNAISTPGRLKTVIVRKTLTAIKNSVLLDFEEALHMMGLWDRVRVNKQTMVYILDRNKIFQFVGLDKAQKRRGAKQDFLFCNEANELHRADFLQLIIRTTRRAILDYNPSDENHWIYDDVLTRDDADFFQTTYLDNPFLEQSVVDEIERLRRDPELWAVFGLGERGMRQSRIYRNWSVADWEQAPPRAYTTGGIDFGFNDPNVVVTTKIHDGVLWTKEWLYKPGLTNSQLAAWMKSVPELCRITFYADSARPEAIKEIRDAGIDIRAVKKGADSVKHGINRVQSFDIKIDPGSVNMLKEIKMYKWKEDVSGTVLDEPVDLFDHAMDALRYSIQNVNDGPAQMTTLERIRMPPTDASQLIY